jgi:hypothetical protein
VKVRQLFISPGHNFAGWLSVTVKENLLVECAEIHCVAGHGTAGDDFFDFRDIHNGQITFLAREVFEQVCRTLQASGNSSGVANFDEFSAADSVNFKNCHSSADLPCLI